MFDFFQKQRSQTSDEFRKVKIDDFDFERIASYSNGKEHSEHMQFLSDRTCTDLDFEDLFVLVDRTNSKVGQQYLYDILRSIPSNDFRANSFEKIIKTLDASPEIEKSLVFSLSKLNDQGVYFLKNLFQRPLIKRPKWFWVVPVFSFAGLVTSVLAIKFPIFLLILIGVLIVNLIIHYWNKMNILQYVGAISHLIKLSRVAKLIRENNVLVDPDLRLDHCIKSVDKIRTKSMIFRFGGEQSSDLGQLGVYLIELVKATILIEPLLFFKVCDDLKQIKTEIELMFQLVGQIDVAISIRSLRLTSDFTSIPKISDRNKSLVAEKLYHPLLANPVANSFGIPERQSLLVTGSNMSGKSTFIKTLGVNALLSQTINTVFARSFSLPRCKIHSSMRIADSLMDAKSYYMEEVLAIKEMVEENANGFKNLFLLDELYKGTNTKERIAAGAAVLAYLHSDQNFVIAATHDLELVNLLSKNYLTIHFNEKIEGDNLTFDYLIKQGKPLSTNAIKILELNGYPENLIKAALNNLTDE